MAGLNGQWKALQKQLARLEVQTRKVRGETRKRLKRVERQTRIAVRKSIRQRRRAAPGRWTSGRIGRGWRRVRAGTAPIARAIAEE